MSILSRMGAVVLTAAAAAGIAVVSHVPVPLYRSPDALLRVAFSARPERVESCRTLSDEELAGVPEHMRQRVVCEGSTASYRLEVRREGELLAAADVRGGGLRHDRQLYVLRELALPSGSLTLEVTLTRVETGAGAQPASPDGDGQEGAMSDGAVTDGAAGDGGEQSGRDERERDERRRRMEDAVPASLAWKETVVLEPREVLLVTYDQQERRLRAVRGAR